MGEDGQVSQLSPSRLQRKVEFSSVEAITKLALVATVV
jgi:hypothetical protein